MASFTYLSDKKCACCLTRLDKVPKRGLSHANNDDNFLSRINTTKPIILSKKGKIYDNIPIVLNDIICGTCKAAGKRYVLNPGGTASSSSSARLCQFS